MGTAKEDQMVRWNWWQRLGSAVLVPLMVCGGPALGQVTEKYDPLRQITVQVVPANLMIVLDRSGSMAQDRYGNGFVRGPGVDGEYFTADDEFGSVDRRDLSKPLVAGENTNYFHPGVPYGSPMVDKPEVGRLDNPPNLALSMADARTVRGENSTGRLRWKAAEPAGCPGAGSGLTGVYFDGASWKLPGNQTNGTADVRAVQLDAPIDFTFSSATPPPGGDRDRERLERRAILGPVERADRAEVWRGLQALRHGRRWRQGLAQRQHGPRGPDQNRGRCAGRCLDQPAGY